MNSYDNALAKRITDTYTRLVANQKFNPALQANVSRTMDNHAVLFKDRGWIQDFIVKCNDENNPPETVAAGKIILDVFWKSQDGSNVHVGLGRE